MLERFAGEVETWHEFYLLVGTASATLVGLLFIALTLNPELLRRDNFGATGALARQSFSCFVNLLTLSGVMLIPNQSPKGVGIPLVSIGGISLVVTLQRMIARRHQMQSGDVREILRHTALLIIGMGALLGLGIGLLTGHDGLLVWLTGAVLTLLSAASNNAWSLLTTPPPPAGT